MARSVSDATFGFGINGLVRSVTGAIEAQSETRKGLPTYIKVVGSNKLWTGEISGDVTDTATISLTHEDKVACDVVADGISVNGWLTSFSCNGSSNSIVEFRAGVEGGKTSDTSTDPSTNDPGDPVFLEECTVTGISGDTADIIDFSLDCSWELEHTFSTEEATLGEPTSDGTSFKSFDGTFVYTTSATASDVITASGDTETFSIVAGGLNITGTGKVTKVEQTAEVDDIVRYKKTITVISLADGSS